MNCNLASLSNIKRTHTLAHVKHSCPAMHPCVLVALDVYVSLVFKIALSLSAVA